MFSFLLQFYNFINDTSDPCDPVFTFVVGRYVSLGENLLCLMSNLCITFQCLHFSSIFRVCSLETVDQTRLLCAIELPLSDVLRPQVESISHDAPASTSSELVTNDSVSVQMDLL